MRFSSSPAGHAGRWWNPRLGRASRQPGQWYRGAAQVDLLVPERLAGSGRRAVTVPPHDGQSLRRVRGMEASLVDHDMMPVPALDANDPRTIKLQVAGPMALIVSKAHKLHERLGEGRGDRIQPKDAHDLYRLLLAVQAETLVQVARRLLGDDMSREATTDAIGYLQELFADERAPGPSLVADAETIAGTPDLARVQSAALARRLIDQLT